MASSWFVRGNGKVYGPLDSAKLKQLVADGKIDQTTEVAQQQNGPWVPAGRVKGLFVQPPIPADPAPAPRATKAPAATAVAAIAPAPVALPTAQPVARKRGGYVDSNLLPNEQVVYRANLHWFYFLRPILWFAFAFFLFRTGASMNASERDAGLGAIILGVLVVFAGIFSAIAHVITYKTSEFAVTNRRVIMKQGFIRRKTMELMLGKVDSLAVDQGIFGRIFGFGTVRVTVATEKQSFPFLAKPLEFRRQVQLQTPA
jgi:membrane protein YdbS with pleckstrin-like domain